MSTSPSVPSGQDHLVHRSSLAAWNALPLPVFVLDHAGLLLWTNQAGTQIPGHPLVPGRTLASAFLDPQAAGSIMETLANLELAGKLERDIRLKNPEGAAIAGILTIQRADFQLGHHQGRFIATLQDTTSRSVMESIMETSFDNFIQSTNNLDMALQKIKQQRSALSRFRLKIMNELNVARMVQKSILAKNFPHELSFECMGMSRSSEEIGGDYLDVLHLDEHRYGFIVADVSGHGVAPALVTAILRAWVHDEFPKHSHVDTFLAELNSLMYDTFAETGFYFTAMCMILDTVTGELELCSAGHDALLRVRATDVCDIGTLSGGRVVGALPDSSYTYQVNQLVPGDILVCHTDGISECRSRDGTFYGRERLAEVVQANLEGTLDDLVARIIQDVDQFSAGEKQKDDQTLLVIKWNTTLI